MAFDYNEIMPARFIRHLPDSLNLSKTVFVEAKLIRLLLGMTDMSYSLDGTIIPQRKNYSNALVIANPIISSKIIKDSFKPLKIVDIDNYLIKFKNVNFSLHNDILFELSLYFLNRDKGNHVSSFLHLYRILEFMSYSFPLIHSSLSRTYTGTFKALQSYFSKDGGELEFIDKFIDKLFDDNLFMATTIDIGITAPTPLIQSKIYKSYKAVLGGFSTFDDASKTIFITYSKIVPALIFIRNRYFHFAIGSGQKNIKSSDIEYPDIFFQQINEPILNWLSMIYFETLKTSISNWKN